ncbi:MAG TPA: cytochrome c biogenesis protein CcdA [Vicinamibacterales bacterium]|jgi:thiol:disulfide interchange protein|nr:cytochrome c biogenesis protein CcdA [Vicinamibacterales bacterium]
MRRLARFGTLLILLIAAAAPAAAQQGPADQKITVEPIVQHAAAHPGTTIRVALKVSIPAGLHMQSHIPKDPSQIPAKLKLMPPAGVTVTELVYPPASDLPMPGFTQPLTVYQGQVLIGVELAIAKSAAPGSVSIPGELSYQACNDTSCFFPTKAVTSWTFAVTPASAPLPAATHADDFRTIKFGTGEKPAAADLAAPAAAAQTSAAPAAPAATPEETVALFDQFDILATGGYMTSAEFLTFLHDAENGVKPQGMFDGRGPLAILALVFLGGLALNLTPCVLPMIPINLAIIGAGAKNGAGRGRGFVLGSVYGAAMALTYGVLGLVVILTAGTFGTINASPWFNVGIALLFVVLALAMFDVINIDFSRYSSKIQFKQESRGTAMLAFGMGAVAALLAGACVAPVVIQVVVFASDMYTAHHGSALALPFVLGLGMALPWPIAGAGLSALPKPGMWMVRVKQAMGVFILATAAYYGSLAYEGFANRWIDPASVSAGVQEKLKEGWHASLADGLETAKREHTLVLVDFWATWCKNCFVMDRTTLADPNVTAALKSYTKIKFQAESPDVSPAKELMQRIRAAGLPAYVVLRPRS